jgi:hypothetical protein
MSCLIPQFPQLVLQHCSSTTRFSPCHLRSGTFGARPSKLAPYSIYSLVTRSWFCILLQYMQISLTCLLRYITSMVLSSNTSTDFHEYLVCFHSLRRSNQETHVCRICNIMDHLYGGLQISLLIGVQGE